jgi:tetratricopeptide (TPR) repeat protein
LKPRVFIGSSSEGLEVAQAIQSELEHDAESTIWNQGFFPPSRATLESLVAEAPSFDFALIIVHGDDRLESRGAELLAPRDNVIFELGLFFGVLGRERTLFLFNRMRPPKLPTDIAGVTALTYQDRDDGNMRAALGPACHAIREQIKKLGFKNNPRRTAVDLANEAHRLRHKDPVRAMELSKLALQADPLYDLPQLVIFGSLRELGRYEEALTTVGALLEAHPNHSRAYGQRGHLLWALGRLHEALSDFDRAIELEPTYSMALHFRGRVLEGLGRGEEALSSYQKALDIGGSTKFGQKSAARLALLRQHK